MSSSLPAEHVAPRRRLRLTTKLVAALVAILTLVLLAFSAATIALTTRDLERRLDDQVHQTTDRLDRYLRDGRRQPVEAPGQGANAISIVLSDGKVLGSGIIDDDGDVAAMSETDLEALDAAGALAATGQDPQPDGRDPGGDEARGPLRTVTLSIGEYRVETRANRTRSGQAYVAVAGLPTTTVRGPVSALMLIEGLGILGALSLAALLSWLLIKRELRPLERVSQVAGAVASLPLDTPQATLPADRVPAELAQPGTEVGDVGAALNHLLDNVGTALVARQRSEQSLREFVADASHELRTPLAAVRGYSDLVRLTEDLSPDGRAALARVESQTQRMGGLVDDLLLLARLDAGHQRDERPVDVNEVAVEATLDAQAAGPDHRWELTLPEEPLVVDGDPRQLAQVLANLLSNARKHTPAGTRVMTTARAEHGQALLMISDDGPGIPPELLPRIFDRFARGDAQRVARDKTEGSTGLGLAIVRAIVENHGGTVGVHSSPAGTTFEVRLPLAGDAG